MPSTRRSSRHRNSSSLTESRGREITENTTFRNSQNTSGITYFYGNLVPKSLESYYVDNSFPLDQSCEIAENTTFQKSQNTSEYCYQNLSPNPEPFPLDQSPKPRSHNEDLFPLHQPWGEIDENNTFQNSENTSEYCHQILSPNPESFVDENISLDRPDYVDIANLTSQFYENQKMDEATIIIDEDDANNESDHDSVIFVKAYKQPDKKSAIRRNPVREIRSKGRYLQEEHILEDDFDFLEQIEEENLIPCRSQPSKPKSITKNEFYKTWPENSCEMPFYNPETRQIEPIQVPEYVKAFNHQVPKTDKRKSKFSQKIRQRPKASKEIVEKKVPVDTLKDVVSETLEMVEDLVKSADYIDLEFLKLLKTQRSLNALVNAKVPCF